MPTTGDGADDPAGILAASSPAQKARRPWWVAGMSRGWSIIASTLYGTLAVLWTVRLLAEFNVLWLLLALGFALLSGFYVASVVYWTRHPTGPPRSTPHPDVITPTTGDPSDR